MYKIILLIALVVLLGCEKTGEAMVPVSNGNFEVTRLFTTDGCTLYRFKDDGENRYWSKCTGAIKAKFLTIHCNLVVKVASQQKSIQHPLTEKRK